MSPQRTYEVVGLLIVAMGFMALVARTVYLYYTGRPGSLLGRREADQTSGRTLAWKGLAFSSAVTSVLLGYAVVSLVSPDLNTIKYTDWFYGPASYFPLSVAPLLLVLGAGVYALFPSARLVIAGGLVAPILPILVEVLATDSGHNLWPFEYIWLGYPAAFFAVGAFAASRLQRAAHRA